MILKKKESNNSNIWLWVAGLLVIAGIIWWIAADNDEPEVEEAGVLEQSISVNIEPDSPNEERLFLLYA